MKVDLVLRRWVFRFILICCFININWAQTNNHTFIFSINSASAQDTSKRYSGDGGPAIEAMINVPEAVAVDNNGNIFIADGFNGRVRKVDRAGIITTVAGSGKQGFSGDNGPAIKASLNYPAGVITDAKGNLFIADSYNHRIRKVDPMGIITTVAGNGNAEYSGDGGPAIKAGLHRPLGLAFHAGSIFICDAENNRIRKLDPAGIITTIVGDGHNQFDGDGKTAIRASLSFPTSVAIDAKGNIFIADKDNHRIRKVDVSGTITTIAGGKRQGFSGDDGPAIDAILDTPLGVVVDASGNIFITDTGNQRIRKIDSSGIITTIAGSREGYSGDGGAAIYAQLFTPEGLAIDSRGNIFNADTSNHRIRKIDLSGIITTVAGNGKQESTDLDVTFEK